MADYEIRHKFCKNGTVKNITPKKLVKKQKTVKNPCKS